MIVLPDFDPRTVATWKALIELYREHPRNWTLIGAQMVALYACEYGRTSPRVSIDAEAGTRIELPMA